VRRPKAEARFDFAHGSTSLAIPDPATRDEGTALSLPKGRLGPTTATADEIFEGRRRAKLCDLAKGGFQSTRLGHPRASFASTRRIPRLR
jgi:hypothetical protein